ncbi:MAG TPA: hypothetical protein VFW73_05740, partial [Lacipirellulaceae bacterium]|nr:hypothetical protein [Lacipirellulaceae bacterium]
MAAKRVRRRLSLISLPVVVGIGLVGIAKLASWERADLAADLSAAIAHGESQRAIEAIHRLTSMANPSITALVAAADADQSEIAGAGQLAISRLLYRWEGQLEAKQHVRSVASQVSQLSQALADRSNEFSAADEAWLDSTTRKILRLANTIQPPNSPLVALNCDAILRSIGTVRPAVALRPTRIDR